MTAERDEQATPAEESATESGPPPRPPKQPQGLFDSPWTYLLAIPLLVVVYLIVSSSQKNRVAQDLGAEQGTESAARLGDEDSAALAAAIGAAWANQEVDRSGLPARLLEDAQPVYIAFRAGGARLHEQWVDPEDVSIRGSAGTMWDVLLQGLINGQRKLGADSSRVTRLEINLTHTYRRYTWADDKERKLLLDEDRNKVPKHFGVRGLQVRNGDKFARYAPTAMIASNRKVRQQLDRLRERWKLEKEAFNDGSEFTTFEADQVLVRLDTDPVEAVIMFRGNRIVDISEVDEDSTEALVRGMLTWLLNNLHDDGRLTYLYFPATEKESKGNNMIRQWMATNALVRWALDRNDQEVFDAVERNIDYNLGQFFHYEQFPEGGQKGAGKRVELAPGEAPGEDWLGVIEYGNKTKLGATGLAGMAMWLHPKRDKWANEIAALRRMVDHLWHEDGSFTSFYKGPDKEYFNFYPGEAMLFWATIYAETKDPELLRKFKLSFDYYRAWHLEPKNRNPAFVPWHLQADYALWAALGPEEQAFKHELEAFMFETADWLEANMLVWEPDEYTYPDERGRYYAAKKGFGVPHASSTGVYIEGLIDAWRLARDLGRDEERERYRLALIRGIRSQMQLQFVDDVDMFYIKSPRDVVGGIRTTVFRSDIRCDNVQHPMMGIIKVLRDFEASEYQDAE